MNGPARSCESISASTSVRTRGSPAQASSRNAARELPPRSSAASKISLTFSHCSGVIATPLSQLAVQPRAGDAPIPLHRLQRDAQHRGGLVHGEPAKKPQFDDPAQSLVELRQPLERFVECHQLLRLLL